MSVKTPTLPTSFPSMVMSEAERVTGISSPFLVLTVMLVGLSFPYGPNWSLRIFFMFSLATWMS